MCRTQSKIFHEFLHDPYFYMYHSEHTHPHRHITYTGLSSYQDLLDGSFSYSSYSHIHWHGLQQSQIILLFSKTKLLPQHHLDWNKRTWLTAATFTITPYRDSGNLSSAPFMSPGQERPRGTKDREEMSQGDAVSANSLATSRTV